MELNDFTNTPELSGLGSVIADSSCDLTLAFKRLVTTQFGDLVLGTNSCIAVC